MSDLADKSRTEFVENVETDHEAARDRKDEVVLSVKAEYVDHSLVISEEENIRLRRKVYKRVLPLMCLVYVFQSLDRGTLGYSSIMGWQADVGAVGNDYALATTVCYCGIILGEPVVNQLIRRLPVAKVLGVTMLAWSALVTGLSFALNIPSIFAIRFLLGFFEASINPCLIAITVQWFVVEEQVRCVTFWQLSFVAANFISSLLAFGFYHLSGAQNIKNHGLYSWQWLGLCIGIMSFIASILVLIFLPDSPIKAWWTKPDERVKFVERVRRNDQGLQAKVWRSEQAWELLRDPLPWVLCAVMLCYSIITGGLNTFNSLLINKAFGFTVAQSQLLGMPLAAMQALLYLSMAYVITKTNQTILSQCGAYVINVAGTVVLLTVSPSNTTRGGLLFCFYMMQAVQATAPSTWSMLSRNVAGQTKKSIVYALFFSAWAAGQCIGPIVFQARWAPRYIPSLYIHLGVYGAYFTLNLSLRWMCIRRNKKRDLMFETEQVQNTHSDAFADKTDLENMEFRYSY